MAEMWKQCASWLCRLEVLPPNHRIMWPDASIQDLAYALRDGVLLCHVAATIDPAAVDMRAVNQRPQMAQFLCLKNIRHFLNSCVSHFGMRETELFHPSMLYDYTDFARVLNTLSKLSNCPKAQAKEVEGFPQHERAPSQDEEQIYRTLEDMVNEDNYEQFYYQHHGASGAYGGRRSSHSREYYRAFETEEDIYEDLCSFKNSTSRRMQLELSNFQPKEKRDYCIKELVETEGNYVDVLNMLRKHFIRPITCMKDNDKKVVFMNIKELGETHAGFFQDILESVSGNSRKRIGDVFIEYKERFLKYGDYCALLPKAQETLDQLLSRDEMVRNEVAKCEMSANDGKFRLRDLLAVPMQRVLKYHLLLRQLTVNTAPAHDEARSIGQAYEAMLDVSDYINEVKRDSEQLLIIREIQSSITDWNMPPDTELKDYGRLRKDSELKVQSHDVTGQDRGKSKPRYVFVFDKVMLMCKAARGDHYSFKDSLKLADFRVQDPPATQAPQVQAQTVATRTLNRISGGRGIMDTRWAHAFLLVHIENTVAYTMFARTEEDKNKWMAAIREALANVLPPQRAMSSHDAFMFTFTQPRSCEYCFKLLKGLFYQGYRCEKCGKAMHKECISLLAKCGRSAPPTLPPRPPSMLPTTAGGLPNRLSNCSLDEGSSLVRQSSLASVTSLPAVPSTNHLPPPHLMSNGASNPDYINTKMEDHSWHVGDMDRDTANSRLLELPMGTFLVRGRTQDGKCVGHALSLKTHDDVKHMKICTAPGEKEGSQVVYLSDTRKFRSVVELVAWYSRNSLKESFSGLDISLRFSVGELIVVKAQYDFQPKASERNMLPLAMGEKVVVLDRMTGEAQGWWKAFNGAKVGFIPKDFVASIDEADEDAVDAVNAPAKPNDTVQTDDINGSGGDQEAATNVEAPNDDKENVDTNEEVKAEEEKPKEA